MRLTYVTTGPKSTLCQAVLRFQLLTACAVHKKCLSLCCKALVRFHEIVRSQLYLT